MYNSNTINNDTKDILKTYTILYVEDENDIRVNLTKTLLLLFDNVISTSNAEDAYLEYKKNNPDIILSDIGLPDMSGIDLIKLIRKDNSSIPVILLTAYTDTDILLDAVKLKLVDYLTKPATFDDLFTSFASAVTEKTKITDTIIVLKSGITYNTHTKILLNNDNQIHMTKKENRFLDILIEYNGQTVTTEQLKDLVWDDGYYVGDSAFKSLLNKLRLKIGKNSITNVSGIGYFLTAV